MKAATIRDEELVSIGDPVGPHCGKVAESLIIGWRGFRGFDNPGDLMAADCTLTFEHDITFFLGAAIFHHLD